MVNYYKIIHLELIRALVQELNKKMINIELLLQQKPIDNSPAEKIVETMLIQFEAELYKHYLEVGHHFYNATHTLEEIEEITSQFKQLTIFDQLDPNDITENPSL